MSLLLLQKTKTNKEFGPHKEEARHAAGRHQLAPKLRLVHQSLRITEFRGRVARQHAPRRGTKGGVFAQRRVCSAAPTMSLPFFSSNLHTTERNNKGDIKSPTGKLIFLNSDCGTLQCLASEELVNLVRFQLRQTQMETLSNNSSLDTRSIPLKGP